MTNPTSNFGWQMPTSTDLVTDLPADFEVFGQAVDTDFVDLLGGTTGQVLSKTSNTDLDFTWVAANPGDITGVTAGTGISGGGTSGTVTVSIDTAVTADLTTSQTLTNKTLTSPALTTPTISTLTTNGDLLYGTGSGALTRLGIGSSAQVLTVTGGVPAWATPAGGGGKVLQVVSANYTTATAVAVATYTATGLSLSITPTSATSKVLVIVNQQAYFGRDNADQGHGLKIFRGATQIYDTVGAGSAAYNYVLAAGGVEAKTIVPMTFLDSPATTSATTYTTQGRPLYTTNSGQVVYQHASATSTITLMEIGA